jgi:hypothetical protein
MPPSIHTRQRALVRVTSLELYGRGCTQPVVHCLAGQKPRKADSRRESHNPIPYYSKLYERTLQMSNLSWAQEDGKLWTARVTLTPASGSEPMPLHQGMWARAAAIEDPAPSNRYPPVLCGQPPVKYAGFIQGYASSRLHRSHLGSWVRPLSTGYVVHVPAWIPSSQVFEVLCPIMA